MENIAQKLGLRLKEEGLLLVTAESCTGGLVSKLVTDIPGSSSWFDRGFVTYSNEAKSEMLGVDPNIIHEFGAVSEQTVKAMSSGALLNSNAKVAVAISGIAGPEGGTSKKPVGYVCFSWQQNNQFERTESKLFAGDREQVRQQAAQYVLDQLYIMLTS